MYKVSVIMPIFNAEKYLENTLNSVINQTIGFENIELILVDDKSTDNSRSIVEEYSSKYSNIKPIFLEENTGCPGIPRNVGIENATSDYIMFIDNDDEYFPEICDKLYNTIILEGADIVACNELYSDNISSRRRLIDSDRVLLGKEIVYFDNVYIWNCIFKRSIILDNNISFIDGVYEDAIFTLEYYIHSNKLVYLKDFVGYHYMDRNGSLSSISFNRESDMIKSWDNLIKLLGNDCGEYDLSRFFKEDIKSFIMRISMIQSKCEIKELLCMLYDFERKIKFTTKLSSTLIQFINFLVLHNKLNVATYILFILSILRRSNLLLMFYRKIFVRGFVNK